jgi:hypothetical protein
MTTISMILQILATQAAWSFEIYAQPMGQEKQTVQWTEDDVAFQQEIGGIIIEEKIDDQFCYSEQECKRVAQYEMGIVQAQRRRLSFTKITHLQDELGDTIQVVHPYTLQNIKVFINTLTRRFMKAEVEGGEGHFFDDIEGWRLLV